MSQKEPRGAPTVPGVGRSQAKAKLWLLPGTARKRSRLSRTRQDLWGETSWSYRSRSRVAPSPQDARAKSEASPENAARERSRVRTLRQAFLALQAALPAVPPDTKLSKLDVLVLASSYIAHLTRTLGHELPGPAWPPFLHGLCYLHPLKKWPMRSRLYAGGLGSSDMDSTPATASDQRTVDPEAGSQVPGGTDTILIKPLSPALEDK
ncbi:transcription factor 23 [Tupaia chinensis]|uniref:Transcription factor 23 n=1 Tax=Tupaia chinensis TaxID=246437 RepID=L8YGX8_TUPCH|nr:transcription factor 23 [Tupaia chinensis]ELV13741.1 Transcription factor 23 [Tupaia chinensis]